jgi:hypothetical protein
MMLSPAEKYRRYGERHQRLRKQLAGRVATGTVACARCGGLIQPGQAWDLGHRDGGEPYEYAGPEHARCNRATARPSLSVPRVSRRW